MIRASGKRLPFRSKSANVCVTSPPYYGLRTYGQHSDEIGMGSLDEYLNDMVAVCAEIGRVLKSNGLFFLNIADTASGSGGAGGDYNKGGKNAGRPRYKQGVTGLAKMQWCNVPARLSIALQEQGWLLRHEITWDKNRLRPESLDHARRPGVSSEKIFMFAKSERYRFFPEGLKEKGSVWHFPPTSNGRGHLAPFPLELPLRCIAISTVPGDVVLDPFVGSGTTVEAARLLGRRGVGADLYAGCG